MWLIDSIQLQQTTQEAVLMIQMRYVRYMRCDATMKQRMNRYSGFMADWICVHLLHSLICFFGVSDIYRSLDYLFLSDFLP